MKKQIKTFWDKITEVKNEEYVRRDFWGNPYFGRRKESILSKIIFSIIVLIIFLFFISPLFLNKQEQKIVAIIFLIFWVPFILSAFRRKR